MMLLALLFGGDMFKRVTSGNDDERLWDLVRIDVPKSRPLKFFCQRVLFFGFFCFCFGPEGFCYQNNTAEARCCYDGSGALIRGNKPTAKVSPPWQPAIASGGEACVAAEDCLFNGCQVCVRVTWKEPDSSHSLGDIHIACPIGFFVVVVKSHLFMSWLILRKQMELLL